MKNILIQVALWLFGAVNFQVQSQENDGIIGRSYRMFDTSAFCTYRSFHPSEYLTDNNWDILCAFTEPGPASKLDSIGIPYNISQLRLLEVGDLLSSDEGVYSTLMPIFGKEETQNVRQQSKEFADSIFPLIEHEIRKLISAFEKSGYAKQTYSLIFSYLLDDYIWQNDRLPKPSNYQEHGTWSGAYWAMYAPRLHSKIGTNGFGAVRQNWTDELGYWLSSTKLIAFAKEATKNSGTHIDNKDVIEAVDGWGLTDSDGNILIPVMRANSNDDIDLLYKSITKKLADSVKTYCGKWDKPRQITSEKLAQIIFYHEVMWDLLDILESRSLITMPPILRGEEIGKEHFGDICYIVISENVQ